MKDKLPSPGSFAMLAKPGAEGTNILTETMSIYALSFLLKMCEFQVQVIFISRHSNEYNTTPNHQYCDLKLVGHPYNILVILNRSTGHHQIPF